MPKNMKFSERFLQGNTSRHPVVVGFFLFFFWNAFTLHLPWKKHYQAK